MEVLAAFGTLNLRGRSLGIDLITKAFVCHYCAPPMLKLRSAKLAHYEAIIIVELFDNGSFLSILHVIPHYDLRLF